MVSSKKHNIIIGAMSNNLAEIKAALKENPSSITERDPSTDKTALHITAICGFYECSVFLCKVDGVDFEAKDCDDCTPLESAFKGGHGGIMDAIALSQFPELKNLEQEEPSYTP